MGTVDILETEELCMERVASEKHSLSVVLSTYWIF
jgi:hypothetical protein